jgi:beta-phosphoglucomutase-like phosphatase (HAD superfamily)
MMDNAKPVTAEEIQRALMPPAEAQALIFDCDGTLVDSMGLHRIAWTQILGRYDFSISDAWWNEWAPLPVAPMVRAVIPDASDELVADLAEEGHHGFLERIDYLKPIEPVVAVARLHSGRIPMAVVSGGYHEPVHRSLRATGLHQLFDPIITAQDVVASKPAPDGYLKALDMLRVSPDSCVVYEDTEAGMAAAAAAGIRDIRDVRIAYGS